MMVHLFFSLWGSAQGDGDCGGPEEVEELFSSDTIWENWHCWKLYQVRGEFTSVKLLPCSIHYRQSKQLRVSQLLS